MRLSGAMDEPRPEDFGLTDGEVERAPELLISRFRPAIFITFYGLFFAAAFTAIFKLSDSLPASLIFAVILVAAGSIFLIPVVVCVVCASESLETRWLCRRFPALRSCLAYREALAEFRGLPRLPRDRPEDREWWLGLSDLGFRGGVRRAFERLGLELTEVEDRQLAGYDFSYRDSRGRVLIRCEAGAEPVEVGIGREVSACLDETGAHRAVVVTPSGASPRLAAYLTERPIEVIDPVAALGSRREALAD